ncbi:hypothetical protein GH714_038178 [Hevea brasiliensis]|uniref:AMP deaminase n=1 Tax=Hevea brasiliensis TaxID=3981 RepID=A0A6A6LGA6_HEVBR|nr:hypothetical protein GH714_038178 [Hevea brasiliensis]
MDSSLSSLHLAMAALVGASLMAISAFYIHKRTVDQVLDRLIEIRLGSPKSSKMKSVVTDEENSEEEENEEASRYNDEAYGSDGEVAVERKMRSQSASRSLDDKSVLRNYRMSRSMPNALLSNDWFDEDVKFGQQSSRFSAQGQGERLNFVPSGLPPLQMSTRDGKFEITAADCNFVGIPLKEVDSKFQNSSLLFRGDTANVIKGQNIEDPGAEAKVESVNIEEEEVRKMIRECLDLRNRMEDGVVHVYASEKVNTVDLFPVASATTFFTDMHHILRIISIGNVRTACHHRLRFLEEGVLGSEECSPRDFYNIRKVDTHVHHSACMNQKHLLRFIKSKLRKEPDEVVIFRDGKYMTLKEVFESLDLTGYDLNVDLLDVHADKSTFHRFDKFNLKYNPCGQSRLREIFLKQDNLIQGRFLAEVTKEVLSDLEASKYQIAEYRVSIYGRKQSEWDQLASWFVNNAICSENAVWLIQLPRLYNVYKQMGTVKSFQNILDNVFIPLFEVTIDPSSHPQLHVFLMQVVGLDIVDDESRPERRPTKHMPKPAEWTNEFNPAYSYYAYYCYTNLYTLNKLRESKGLPTIKFRPHCGEAGDIDHLAAAFLLCHNISHGINLRKSPVLQYLYYLAQIGLAMSPLSNNSLFLDYHRNPFPMFFQRGLNVSLSSDDPLQIHLTREPLVEEYSIAAKVWKLSSCDLCEIARNSVYQSGFSHVAKLHWLGSKFFLRGPEGNDIHKTNVPHMRIAFRHETWKEEMQYVYSGRAVFPEK